MATKAIGTSNSAIPLKITSQETDTTESLSYLASCLPFVGTAIRNTFYLPWYKKPVPSCLEKDQQLAQKMMHLFNIMHMVSNPGLKIAKEFFFIRDIEVVVEGKMVRTFTVRLFESKMPVNEKKLRVVLFCFNGNTQKKEKWRATHHTWDPLTMKELSDGPLCVLRALKECGIKVDSLVTASLGNVTFDGLRHFPVSKGASIIPPTIVINRGMTSVRKIANQIYSAPMSDVLYYVAKFWGWDANPEQGLLDFLKRENEAKREIVIIEAMKDYYFSDQGGFDTDYHNKIIALSAKVFRANFYPFPFQIRAHHSLSLDHLENNDHTKITANTIPFKFPENEKVSSMIAREIFHKGEGEFHTCFYVAGNDATLDIGAVRDVIPLLAAFVEEGQKLENPPAKLREALQNAS